MQILHSFPKVVNRNFKSAYDGIQWRNDELILSVGVQEIQVIPW
jgi:hypothetical protein